MFINKKNIRICGIFLILIVFLSGCKNGGSDDNSSSQSNQVSLTVNGASQISFNNESLLALSLDYTNMLYFTVGQSDDSRTVTIQDNVISGSCPSLLAENPTNIELDVNGSAKTIPLIAGNTACTHELSFAISGKSEVPNNKIIYTVGEATTNVILQNLSGQAITGLEQGDQFKVHFSKSNPWQVTRAQKYSVTTNAQSVTFSNGGTCTLDQENNTCDVIGTISSTQNIGPYSIKINKEDTDTVTPSQTNISYNIYGNRWKNITLGTYHTCGITETGNKTYCWGQNNYGQLGDGTTSSKNYPTKIRYYTN